MMADMWPLRIISCQHVTRSLRMKLPRLPLVLLRPQLRTVPSYVASRRPRHQVSSVGDESLHHMMPFVSLKKPLPPTVYRCGHAVKKPYISHRLTTWTTVIYIEMPPCAIVHREERYIFCRMVGMFYRYIVNLIFRCRSAFSKVITGYSFDLKVA